MNVSLVSLSDAEEKRLKDLFLSPNFQFFLDCVHAEYDAAVHEAAENVIPLLADPEAKIDKTALEGVRNMRITLDVIKEFFDQDRKHWALQVTA